MSVTERVRVVGRGPATDDAFDPGAALAATSVGMAAVHRDVGAHPAS
ncbi:hypothetical protein [Pseudonocardia parietis]|uniref:Uncharacterized protein n=1 Tax=Pseudonocardia parietis TaxID=570936 RepID=A0ABS4VWA9_9PSEU|nr:hypothetical protein [Pseudonocardia parietis]MBP2368225.1 hypothetical protein [Pseudonocardia parietis]